MEHTGAFSELERKVYCRGRRAPLRNVGVEGPRRRPCESEYSKAGRDPRPRAQARAPLHRLPLQTQVGGLQPPTARAEMQNRDARCNERGRDFVPTCILVRLWGPMRFDSLANDHRRPPTTTQGVAGNTSASPPGRREAPNASSGEPLQAAGAQSRQGFAAAPRSVRPPRPPEAKNPDPRLGAG